MIKTDHLLATLSKIAQLQGGQVDRLALHEIVRTIDFNDAKQGLEELFAGLHLKSPQWLDKADVAAMPMLYYHNGDWAIVRGQNAAGLWVIQAWSESTGQWNEHVSDSIDSGFIAKCDFKKSFSASSSKIVNLVKAELLKGKKLLIEALLASLVINTVGLAVSMYTLIVYDRVIPTSASQTLLVLSLGVFIAIVYEFFSKRIRSSLFEKLIDQVDQSLSRTVYDRFLSLRLDQLPQSVGGLAAQMRGYETVRAFLVGVTSHMLVDAPFAIIYLIIIFLLGGFLGFIPLTFFVLCILLGIYHKNKIAKLAQQSSVANNQRTGLLVETVEGAEAIKVGQGGWRMLYRWLENTQEARGYEQQIRRVGESSQFLVAMFQQFSYILLIAAGALSVSKGELTLGGLIACSILSGRILSPVATIPNQLIQWAYAKAAIENIDQLWLLEDDHYGHAQPLLVDDIQGSYHFENVVSQYGDMAAISVADLTINAGEKVAVVGSVGSGKTTLLRLLTGMYKPQQGRVLLDGMDISQLSKPRLAESISYVQQDVRLFSGTVRENLVLGLIDPGDDAVLAVAKKTGLFESLIAPHPQGLLRPIFEGGMGLSGGQKQLVNVTKALLRDSSIWLLDEPTASMDQSLEVKILSALSDAIATEHTLVLVTHKAELLELVDRVVVVANNTVVMDGPKEVVLQKLGAGAKQGGMA
jgi:ATP-binding cassette subfamily C protein LapB